MRATIVYGFLGAGKTTLLRSLVPQLAALESTALLVNEFGVEGVDQVVLASDDLTVRQLVGGCVCCEVRGDLLTALEQLDRSISPERLVIEPTGLASPDTLAHVFASPSVRSIVDVDSVITVLDATRYALVRDHLGDFFPNQVRHADLVLVNKADAASEEQRLDARAWARGLNAEAAILESVYCEVDPDLLLATVRQGGERVSSGVGARKTPHRFRPGTAEPASPPGEGEGAEPSLAAGLSGERPLGGSGVGARKTPHRLPVGTPASASPPGEGEGADPSPRPSPLGEGGRGDADGSEFSRERLLGDPGLVARKTPHRLPVGTPASASPPGEGERADPSPQPSPPGEGERREASLAAGLSGERPLGGSGVGARKTPHRLPVGTPASASPLGEGEERRLPEERPLGGPGVGARKTPHRLPVGTPASASPPGEGEGAEPSHQSSSHGEGEERRLPEGHHHAHPEPGAHDVDFHSTVPHDDLAASGLERLVLDTGDLPAERVDSFVGDLAAGVYGDVVRAKGFVPHAEGCALVDVVLGAWEVRRFGPAPLYIDVIGRNLNTNEMETAVTHGIKELACTA